MQMDNKHVKMLNIHFPEEYAKQNHGEISFKAHQDG